MGASDSCARAAPSELRVRLVALAASYIKQLRPRFLSHKSHGTCAGLLADRKSVFAAAAVGSTVIAIAPVWSSLAPRSSLSRMSLIAASVTMSLAAGLTKTEVYDILNRNTYSKLSALTKLNEYKKV